MRSLTTFSLVFTVFLVLIAVGDLKQHESQHTQVFHMFGCNANTTYDWLSISAFTKASDCGTFNEAERLKLIELQALVEINGYNNTTTVITIMIAAFLIGTAILLRKNSR